MKPVNRYVRLKEIVEPVTKQESLIAMPHDYRAPQTQRTWHVDSLANDCSVSCKPNDIVIVNDSMIERFIIKSGGEYILILENYIIGIINES